MDNLGNFLISGMAASRKAMAAFLADIKKQGAVLRADEIAFDRRFGKSKMRFVFRGSLRRNVPKEDNSRKRVPESPKTVLDGILAAGRASGVGNISKVTWGASKDFGAWKKHLLSLQVESSYAGLIRWIRRVYEQDLPIGYSQVSLTSVGRQKILTSVQYYVYAKN